MYAKKVFICGNDLFSMLYINYISEFNEKDHSNITDI